LNKKILFAIFTCNRFYYLKNCIESILECHDLDRIDVLICDNCSIEDGYEEYLNNIANNKNITVKRFEDRTRNELYRAMNWTIEYAKKCKYDIVNLIQDDFQFLYRNDDLLDDVINIFNSNDNVVQINTNLMWKRKKDRHGKLKNINSKFNYAIMMDKNPCDNGFTRVSVYNKVGAYPSKAISWGHGKDRYVGKMNGELWFGKRCSKYGYKRAVCYMANAGMIFDCAYVRGHERFGKYFPPPNKHYLKILPQGKIEKIRRNQDKKRFSFIEDLCIPDGWTPSTMGKHGSEKIVIKI